MSGRLHEPIISNDVWNLAQEKRIKTKGASEKIYDKEHLHLLTGMLLCPKCGNKMYTNVNRRTSKNGTVKSIYYYCCKHHYDETGKSCSFNKSIRQEKLDAEIIEIIKSIFVQKEVVNIGARKSRNKTSRWSGISRRPC